MKKFLTLVAAVTCLAAAALDLSPPSGNVVLSWSYPAESLSPDLTFRVYASTNLATPITNWACLTNIAGTNLSASVKIQPGQMFFVMTASNFWGESLTSNVAATPKLPLPAGDTLTIKRAE